MHFFGFVFIFLNMMVFLLLLVKLFFVCLFVYLFKYILKVQLAEVNAPNRLEVNTEDSRAVPGSCFFLRRAKSSQPIGRGEMTATQRVQWESSASRLSGLVSACVP